MKVWKSIDFSGQKVNKQGIDIANRKKKNMEQPSLFCVLKTNILFFSSQEKKKTNTTTKTKFILFFVGDICQ